MAEDRDWFIGERSEALASLLLTSQPGLSISNENGQDDGADFVVALSGGESVPPTQFFVVQVKGTLSSEQKDWTEITRPLYDPRGAFYLPVCVFVINVRGNDAVYAWVAEPEVKNGQSALNFVERPDFHPLDADSLHHITDRVRSWYDSMPHAMASHSA